MAKRGQGSKPKTGAKVPMTGEEKAARAALVRSQQLATEATQSRVSTASRGAFSSRRLRTGGTELQRYAIGGYGDDPFPKPGGYTGGGANPSGPSSGTTRRTTSKPKKSGGKKSSARRDVRKTGEGGNQRYSPRSPGTQGSKVVNTKEEKQRRAEILAAEKAKAEAARRKRIEAARRKKAAQKQTKVVTGGRVMS